MALQEQLSGTASTLPSEGFFVTKTQISADKISAYQSTHYRVVHSDGEIVLKIGNPSPRLFALLKEHRVTSGAFLTAFNPRGAQQSDAENELAHAWLTKELGDLGVKCIDGKGGEENSDWPVERSVFALGLSLANATELANRANQDAFVWVGVDGIPQLILLR